MPHFQFPNYNNLPGAVPPAAPVAAAADPSGAAAPADPTDAAAAAAPFVGMAPFQLPPMQPAFPMFSPYQLAAPPPMPPVALDRLTDDELRRMEGNERQHIEERLRQLANVRLLLDASAAMMQQYTAVVTALPPLPQPPPPPAVELVIPQLVVPPVLVASPGVPAPEEAAPEADAHAVAEPQPGTSAAASTEGASTSAAFAAPSTSAAAAAAAAAEVVRIEDVGSEEHIDRVQSAASLAGQANASQAELRRRRLQKFGQAEQQQ